MLVTSDEDITFYAAQGTIPTNTGEQIKADGLSDHIEDETMVQMEGERYSPMGFFKK